jgi:hypothetical protein
VTHRQRDEGRDRDRQIQRDGQIDWQTGKRTTEIEIGKQRKRQTETNKETENYRQTRQIDTHADREKDRIKR